MQIGEKMKIWIDGSGNLIEGQKGKSIVLFEDGETLEHEYYSKTTNNEAEYKALIDALLDEQSENSIIYTDSQLLVGQVCNGWKIKAENLKPFVEKSKELLKQRNAILKWIPREENKAGKLLEK